MGIISAVFAESLFQYLTGEIPGTHQSRSLLRYEARCSAVLQVVLSRLARPQLAQLLQEMLVTMGAFTAATPGQGGSYSEGQARQLVSQPAVT